jgi:secreted protein with Ig-like and vWFA domain
MSDENKEPDLQTWIDPELEARIVAWVLGEASEFEAAELSRILAEKPELGIFKRRIEAVHGLVTAASRIDLDPMRLSEERRQAILEKIGVQKPETPVVAMPQAIANKETEKKRPFWKTAVGIAAIIVTVAFLAGIAMPAYNASPNAAMRARIAMMQKQQEAELDQSNDHIAALQRPPPASVSARASSISADQLTALNALKALASQQRASDDEEESATGGFTANGQLSNNEGAPLYYANSQADIKGDDGQRLVVDNGWAMSAHAAVPAAPSFREELPVEAAPASPPAATEASTIGGGVGGVAEAALAAPANGPPMSGGDATGAGAASASPPQGNGNSEAVDATLNSTAVTAAPAPIVASYAVAASAAPVQAPAPPSPATISGQVEGRDATSALNAPGEPVARAGQDLALQAQASPQIAKAKEMGRTQITMNLGKSQVTVIGGNTYTGSTTVNAGNLDLADTDQVTTNSGMISNLQAADASGAGVVQDRSKSVSTGGTASNGNVLKDGFGMPGQNTDSAQTAFKKPLEQAQQAVNNTAAPSTRNIAALGTDQAQKQMQGGVPILGDIPSLGRAFKSKQNKPAAIEVPSQDEVSATDQPFSTFSLHVSDVSFLLAKDELAQGQLPDPASVRPEEFYNAFDYGDPAPGTGEKIACRIEQAAHPVFQQRNLVRIAMKVADTGRGAGQPLQLTILLDTSGSMEREDRADSIHRAMQVLTSLLGPDDAVTLISFAREPRLLAEELPGDQAGKLVDIVKRIPPEGGTNMEEALKLAAQLALRHYKGGGQNRIVMLTDGAANLGDADPDQLSKLVADLRQKGVSFDACGVGANGLNDDILEALTRKGGGRYYFLNQPEDAAAGFAQELAGAFRPAAENVKMQVRFNPDRVGKYRLIGFDKNRLNQEDFRNDKVTAAQLAAEEAAVALYQVEVLPEGQGELGEVYVRFRDPVSGQMVEQSWTIPYDSRAPELDKASPSMQLATTSALLAEKLRGGAAAEAIDLDALEPIIANLRTVYRQQQRVWDLATMFEEARRMTSQR